jgi:ABC-2 type transport system permease protein
MSDGIADLSYRHYDGPLEEPRHRWRVIAFRAFKEAIKKKPYWVLTSLGGWYYLAQLAFLYIMGQVSGAEGAGMLSDEIFNRIVWNDQFLHGVSSANLMWMLLTLSVGSAAIASDNRTNSLLIYLSRPCTKLDYLKGKWMSVFMPLCFAMIIPALIFYAYCALNYQSLGFISDDPWLIARILILFPTIAAFHASMVVGISSLFKEVKHASVTYAGLYLMTFLAAKVMSIIALESDAPGGVRRMAEIGSYMSVDGVIRAITKLILNTDGSPKFGILPSDAAGFDTIPRPPEFLVISMFIGLCALALFIAWRRIRAVEVVK